jgi:tetratricopeptide (TPR) repeat protein
MIRITGAFILFGLFGLLTLSPPLVGVARAGNTEEARVYLDKATAAYALNRYSVAAENFEKAFELKPDPALLYNAAQSYRLAGNKERALELYESYLRVYGKKDPSKREQIEGRIKELKQAIEHDKAVATSPPVTTEPVGVPGPDTRPPAAAAPPPAAPVQPLSSAPSSSSAAPPPPAAPPPASASSSAVVLTQTGTPAEDESIVKKPWFWVVVGGGVVAAAVTVLLLAKGGTNPAMPTLGRANGN